MPLRPCYFLLLLQLKNVDIDAIPYTGKQKAALASSSTILTALPLSAALPLQVKNIDIEAMPRAEEKEMFRDFMEEYNTASLPHK